MTAPKTPKSPRIPPATVSVKQAALLLGISQDKVREGIRDGTIAGFSYGARPNYKVYRVQLLRMVGYPEDYNLGE